MSQLFLALFIQSIGRVMTIPHRLRTRGQAGYHEQTTRGTSKLPLRSYSHLLEIKLTNAVPPGLGTEGGKSNMFRVWLWNNSIRASLILVSGRLQFN